MSAPNPTLSDATRAKLHRAEELRLAVDVAAAELGLATSRVSVAAALASATDSTDHEMAARMDMRAKQRAFREALAAMHDMLKAEIGRME